MKFDARPFATIENVKGQQFLIVAEINEDADSDQNYRVRICTNSNMGFIDIKLSPFHLDDALEMVASQSHDLALHAHSNFSGLMGKLTDNKDPSTNTGEK